ncbi:troponin T, cardiac muscle isoform X6 [Orcinus orca]|uniref:troponin T, cardiac muscle isoform X6 n=1 Tax=Orcinus orca TaxID=9733 RepID=UPI0021111085|nr:troponin T, cardiac muscle isoform X6 [Orcinus orca]
MAWGACSLSPVPGTCQSNSQQPRSPCPRRPPRVSPAAHSSTAGLGSRPTACLLKALSIPCPRPDPARLRTPQDRSSAAPALAETMSDAEEAVDKSEGEQEGKRVPHAHCAGQPALKLMVSSLLSCGPVSSPEQKEPWKNRRRKWKKRLEAGLTWRRPTQKVEKTKIKRLKGQSGTRSRPPDPVAVCFPSLQMAQWRSPSPSPGRSCPTWCRPRSPTVREWTLTTSTGSAWRRT